jgi:predicted transcriptional regulator of viral defense system
MTVLSRSSTTSRISVRVRPVDERRLLDRIRAEFLEMPGLDLTLAQARRLWGLDRLTCEYLCGRLLEDGFLERTSRGTYVLGARGWSGRAN